MALKTFPFMSDLPTTSVENQAHVASLRINLLASEYVISRTCCETCCERRCGSSCGRARRIGCGWRATGSGSTCGGRAGCHSWPRASASPAWLQPPRGQSASAERWWAARRASSLNLCSKSSSVMQLRYVGNPNRWLIADSNLPHSRTPLVREWTRLPRYDHFVHPQRLALPTESTSEALWELTMQLQQARGKRAYLSCQALVCR